MKARLFFYIILVFAVGFIVTTFAEPVMAEQKTIKWRMAFWGPRLPTYSPIYDEFREDVNRASNGRLIIEDVYDGEGIPGSQVLPAVGRGLAEMGIIATVYHAGEFPAGIIEWGLPGLIISFEEYWTLFEQTKWEEVLTNAYAKQNVHWLSSHPTHATYMLTKKPIKTFDDLKGMKLRAVGANAKFVRNLGGVAVSVPWAEMYTGLATGVFDGLMGSPIQDIYDGKFYELAKYLCPTPMSGFITNPFIVNSDAWKKLPDDLQQILKLAADKLALTFRAKLLLVQQEKIQEMKSKGLQWGPELSKADQHKWKEAGKKVWSEYTSEKFSKELIEIQTDFMEKMK